MHGRAHYPGRGLTWPQARGGDHGRGAGGRGRKGQGLGAGLEEGGPALVLATLHPVAVEAEGAGVDETAQGPQPVGVAQQLLPWCLACPAQAQPQPGSSPRHPRCHLPRGTHRQRVAHGHAHTGETNPLGGGGEPWEKPTQRRGAGRNQL